MASPRSELRNRLEYVAFRLVRALVWRLGRRGASRFGAALGALYHLLGRRRRRVLADNLALALPELAAAERRRLARAVARHFGRAAVESLRLQRISVDDLLAATEIVGREHLEGALALGRGIFVLTAHLGCWEVAALVTGLIVPGGLAVVNRPLDNPRLEAQLELLRGRFGNRALGKRRVMRSILETLRAGGAVGMLLDQRARRDTGVVVPFFGRPALTHVSLARLVLASEAPVVPLWSWWLGPGRYRVEYQPPLLVDELDDDQRERVPLTARLTAIIEAGIRRRPEQWLWYHERWKMPPEVEP